MQQVYRATALCLREILSLKWCFKKIMDLEIKVFFHMIYYTYTLSMERKIGNVSSS